MNPWHLFKSSEAILAFNISSKISETFLKIASLDLNLISDNDKTTLLALSDNSVPFEWRKIWQGPNVASEFLKSVTIRIQTALKFLDHMDDEIIEIDLAKIFNADSFLSTLKLVSSRSLKVSTSNLIMESTFDDKQYERIKHGQFKLVKLAPLMIDGLAYSENSLVISNGYNSSNMSSHVYIYFKEEHIGNTAQNQSHMHDVPLYSNFSREKQLCTIKINSNLHESDIIYSGTALIVPSN